MVFLTMARCVVNNTPIRLIFSFYWVTNISGACPFWVIHFKHGCFCNLVLILDYRYFKTLMFVLICILYIIMYHMYVLIIIRLLHVCVWK